MERQGYISRKKKEASEYESLHQEALEILQKLCGEVWTDYNEHDPGVTLLENIAYTLTELAYKSRTPIKDLLISKRGETLQSGDNGLFTASDILTTGPITFNDYRKLWIDKIVNVKNVWVYPIDNANNHIRNTKGLLHVLIEKYTYWTDEEQEKEDNIRIRKEVRNVYHRHRNLCEDIFSSEIFKPLDVSMQFKITLSDEVKGEEILANIFNKINQYLAPEIKYYSLWKLKEQERATNAIFNGPLLSSGFIMDEDLQEPRKQIVISEIVALITTIHGVKGVPHFYLSYKDTATKEDVKIKDIFNIPEYTTATILFPKDTKEMIFENSGVVFNPDLEETKKQLAFIQALNYGDFRKASTSLNELTIPKGNYQDFMAYYPLRKQFPQVYGIGEMGIGTNAPPLRKAQVKQLKAYLMPFDQLMVNFLAQLKNVHALYDVEKEKKSSYFTQNVPDIDTLLDMVKKPKHQTDPDEIKAHWNQLLQRLNKRFDTQAMDRFNSVLDHILARFDEIFPTYSLRKINSNSYGGTLASQKFEKQLLRAKRRMIKEYASISYNRARSFDYHQLDVASTEKEQLKNLPGTIRKIAILLGINLAGVKSLTKNIIDQNLIPKPESREFKLIVNEIDIHTPEGEIHIIETEEISISTTTKGELYNTMHYVGAQETLLEEVLKNGVLRKNYTIQQDTMDEATFYVMYHRGDQKSNIAHISKSMGAAKTAIKKAIDFLVALNQKSEGFFVVEHLLLLPPYSGDYFGFQLDFSKIIKGAHLEIHQPQLSSCRERDHGVLQLVALLSNGKLQFIWEEQKGNGKIYLKTPKNKLLAISRNEYRSEQEAIEEIQRIKNGIQEVEKEVLEASIGCKVFFGEEAVDEDFFSFRTSFVAPSWPVRFQSKNFKSIFEQTVYGEMPIHIASSFFWKDFNTMCQFEELYLRWLALLQQKESIETRVAQAHKLITLLQNWTENGSDS
ncbi:hypothetical protein [Spongiimicrobium salis]|uniref:hypothetical protein n=1 Tax=Spongiimicrobium salis TaxID=1667022 RepID=UPI00374CA585